MSQQRQTFSKSKNKKNRGEGHCLIQRFDHLRHSIPNHFLNNLSIGFKLYQHPQIQETLIRENKI